MRRLAFSLGPFIASALGVYACTSFAGTEGPPDADSGSDGGGVVADGSDGSILTSDAPANGGDATSSTTHIYVAGGQMPADGGLPSALVQFAEVQSDGGLSAWQATTALPDPVTSPGLVATDKALVILGGGEVSGSSNLMYRSVPNAVDGTLGLWAQINQSLDVVREQHSAVRVKSHVYVVGGHSSNAGDLKSTLDFTLDANDILGAPTLESELDEPRYLAGVAATSTHVYVVGGEHKSIDTGLLVCSSAILSSQIKPDGSLGDFAQESPPLTTQGSGVIIHNDRLYILGGWRCPGITAEVASAAIDANGTLGALRKEQPMPDVLVGQSVVVVGDSLYAIGGDNGNGTGSTTASVYVTTINADGTLAVWHSASSLMTATSYAGAVAY